jgi:hypothetical protein
MVDLCLKTCIMGLFDGSLTTEDGILRHRKKPKDFAVATVADLGQSLLMSKGFHSEFSKVGCEAVEMLDGKIGWKN